MRVILSTVEGLSVWCHLLSGCAVICSSGDSLRSLSGDLYLGTSAWWVLVQWGGGGGGGLWLGGGGGFLFIWGSCLGSLSGNLCLCPWGFYWGLVSVYGFSFWVKCLPEEAGVSGGLFPGCVKWQPLKRAVRILLEYILVEDVKLPKSNSCDTIPFFFNFAVYLHLRFVDSDCDSVYDCILFVSKTMVWERVPDSFCKDSYSFHRKYRSGARNRNRSSQLTIDVNGP